MGLAATRTKQRFGLDPRNTAWSNDTSRFGHKLLEKFGWQPGTGLGMLPGQSHKSHIKVHIKDDNLGLGAKIKRQERKDEFDNGECAGLDVFQRILGRLNGKEEEIVDELEKQRKDKILSGKWGIHFLKGEVLASTWDPKTKKLKSYSNERKRKYSNDEDDADDDDDEEEDQKNSDSESDVVSDSDVSSDRKTKGKKKKDKKERKEKKHKKRKLDKKTKKSDKNIEKEKKKQRKKEKKAKKVQKRQAAFLESSKTASKIPDSVSTRLSVRSKWIKQKRAAIMDAKALNEIFMIKND
ncbi:telomerase inhibitor NDAI_0B00630 [Naumovozyma dairenensis CBS 421]|uniref:Protein PXR1 n=1 Tax=Naumovozyma dairenensis (strain ATCC 10597 / BCRC 20456 / CBS 421 / NBRC 0211 / NRRL Y-12639) TaxID=1071378 RepID=G0W5N6_NAUDC|nr:hypothetical protein NDAI_0B00630 [Naumovozyma dairenensis CBS 421]CCD23097.1 hypothetical protein NDAI_0B00630 [Naumovozyma dairenensis CBS 421]